MGFTKEFWNTSGNLVLENPSYRESRECALEAATYPRSNREQHKLRIIVQPANGPKVVGISLPEEKVGTLIGVYFYTQVLGTTIILQSGARP